MGLLTSFQNFLNSNGITLAVILTWIYTYRKSIKDQKRVSKIKAYEEVLKAYWNLYGRVSEDKLEDIKYYKTLAPTTQLEIWAPEYVINQGNKFCDGIIKLNMEHDSSQRMILQESCRRDFNLLVNKIRLDLGISQLSEKCFDEQEYILNNDIENYQKINFFTALKMKTIKFG